MSIFPITDIDNVFINLLSLDDKLKMIQCNKYYNELCNDVIVKEYKILKQKRNKYI